jgi:hypothetical protein
VTPIDESVQARETNRMVARFLEYLRGQKRVSAREFCQRFSRVPGFQRKRVIQQMCEDGQIRVIKDGRGDFICLCE